MKNPKLILLFGSIVLICLSCKKEEVDPQEFIKQYLIGKWPLKYQVRTVFTDNIASKPDTLVVYNPIDTLEFTTDGKAILRNKSVISTNGYTIGATGENVTFSSTPAATLQLTFVRNTSFGLGKTTVSQVNGKETRTVVDDHYIK